MLKSGLRGVVGYGIRSYPEEAPVTYATDTHDEKQAFVPERELQAALAEARTTARQRDELAAENARLKRETDDVKGPDAHSRRATILREALNRKDQEILWLKDHALTREKQLVEAREAVAALRREVTTAEGRGRAASGADDRQRAATEGELTRLTAQHATVIRERDALARQVDELRPLMELKVREADARARLALAETAAEAARARLQSARENHAMALRAAEDDHAEELAVMREALAASERKVEAAEARCAGLEATLASERGGVAALRAEIAASLEAAQSEFDAEVTALRRVCERAVEAAASASAAQARAEAEATAARQTLAAAVAEAVEAAELRAEDSGRAVHEAYGAELAALREAQAAEAAAMVDAHNREVAVLREQAESHAARADGEAERASGIGRALEETMAESKALALDLEAARVALTEQVTAAAARLEAAERVATETATYRDRYARRLSTAMELVRASRREADRAAEGLAVEARALSTLVGRLTARWVLDGARVSALQAGRQRPEARDVDEALSWVAEEVPDPVAEELWAARDALIAQCMGLSS